jgi:hypothetical protein
MATSIATGALKPRVAVAVSAVLDHRSERDDEDETEGTPIDVHGAPQALAGWVTPDSGSWMELALTGFFFDAR